MHVEHENGWRAWLMLLLLFVAYNFSLLDRMILSLLAEPIKRSLSLSDTQLSLLQGLAFLVLYSVAGVPIGLLIDRFNRTRLIAGAVALWGLMTVLCGASGSFPALFAARVGVGVGEAALSPGAYSLIASRFSSRRLGLALGLYSVGGASGAGLAMIVGAAVFGALGAHGPVHLPVLGAVEPWKATFVAVGLPGFLIAALIACLREPQRPKSRAGAAWTELSGFYRDNWRVVAPLHLGVAFSNAALFGAMSWIAPFFGRVHGWPIQKVGALVGLLQMLCGLAGLAGGGLVSDALARRGAGMRLAFCAVSAALGAVCAVVMSLAPTPVLSLAGVAGFLVCAFVPYNVANVAYQTILPPGMRGVASSIFLLVVSLLSALSPTVIGLLNDHVFGAGAGTAKSLAVCSGGALVLSSVAFMAAWRPYVRLWVSAGPEANRVSA